MADKHFQEGQITQAANGEGNHTQQFAGGQNTQAVYECRDKGEHSG